MSSPWFHAGALAAIVDSSDDAIISKDLNGIIRSWNGGAQRIFGYTAEEAVGKPVAMLAVPERRDEMAAILARIRQGERIDHHETKRQAKDGRILTISLTVSPIRDPTGQIVGAAKVARDITDEKRSAEIKDRLAAIVESSDDAIIGKDLNGIIQSWNRGAERLFGYTAEEVIGRPVSILAVPGRREEMPDILERIRLGERIDHYETMRQTKDGRALHISLTVSPIRDHSGTIIGASKVARDITERKLAAEAREALLRREKELREAAELLNQIGPALVAELNTETLAQTITDIATRLASAQFGAMFRNSPNGHGEAAQLYTVSGAQSPIPPPSMPRSTELFASAVPGQVFRSADITSDPGYIQPPTADADPIKSYLTVPIISRSGDVLADLCFGHSAPGRFTEWHERIVRGIAAQAAIAMDNARLFAELRRSRESAERSNEELRRANEDLEQFAYSASHDLKEPLRMVALYSQILQRKFRENLDAEALDHLSCVINSARRMDKLVQDLLAYTKLSASGDAVGVPSPVSATSILKQAARNLIQPIQETGARIEHGHLPTLFISEVHLLLLFQNLLENALKYRGIEPPHIRVEAHRETDFWRLCVHDNGIGIAPEYKDQVFGIFKRLHPADKYSGTGIGLAICQKLVARYGGRIWVESSGEGQGATFCFTLPGGDLEF